MDNRQRQGVACSLALLLALQWLFSTVADADAPITLAAYRSVVGDSLRLIEQAVAQKDFDARVPLFNRAADLLNSAHMVQLDTGEQVTIHNEPLVRQIRAQAVAGTASAQQLAGMGDYRTAMRQLYLSTLLWLDEHAYLRYDRSLTNREYLRALAKAPALRDALQPVVEAFDRVWYGFAPISAPEFERYRNQVDAIRNLSH